MEGPVGSTMPIEARHANVKMILVSIVNSVRYLTLQLLLHPWLGGRKEDKVALILIDGLRLADFFRQEGGSERGPGSPASDGLALQ